MGESSGDSLIDQQKYRALRIDHAYHGRPHRWRSWMWLLSFVLPVGAALALGALLYSKKDPALYEPGPISNRHIWFNQSCDKCHETENGKFGVVSNAKCRECHDGPLHSERQLCPGGEKVEKRVMFQATSARADSEETQITLDEPRCATCHTEHKGAEHLIKMSDNHCTQCHADLKVKEGPLKYKSGITSFVQGHPDWRALRKEPGDPVDKGNDPTPLKFNHAKHMEIAYDQESKYGPRKMQCGDCHRSSDSNLETMLEGSPRLDEFVEKVLKKSERDAFYADVIAAAEGSGMMRYNLRRIDIRKLAVEALSRRDVYAALQKSTEDRVQFRAILERAVLDEVQERFGNAAGGGQKRYMLPITYEKHCASECHTHELVPVNGVVPPHGTADNARRALRAELYAQSVRQALGAAAPKSDAEKAKLALVKKVRDALEADVRAAGTAIPAGKSAMNKVLIDAMNGKEDLHAFLLKALGGNESDALKLLADSAVDGDQFKNFDSLSKSKKEKVLTDLPPVIEALIGSYVDDKPVDAKELDTLADEKVAEGTKKLFAPTSSEKGACLFCHMPNEKRPAEVVIEPAIPERWLNHGVFNHETHRMLNCESCHSAARSSRETADVLLPGIKNCQICHNPDKSRMDCIECHLYHDKTHQKQDKTMTIESLIGNSPPAPVPGAK